MNPLRSLLLTDLYQLTMLAAYHDRGMTETAVFEYFVRELPESRNFLIATGLDQAIAFLEDLHFEDEDLEWLSRCGRFGSGFVEAMAKLRFTGELWAAPEGTIVFADEPLLQVVAPLPEAQLIETRLINIVHFQTMIASKAARCVLAAPGKQLVDFGLRRSHGAEAGLLAARATYLAGFAGTSTVVAEPVFGIPVFGTMAHSFVQAHESEDQAFGNFARSHPDNVVLLIDTYDTEAGAANAVAVSKRLSAEGIHVRAVRIDSGDLGRHAKRVRAILDSAGLDDVGIFASGNLDELRLASLIAEGAPIDGFGVGTKLGTSADAPYLESAYKLVEYGGKPVRKKSEGKATWPGRKQVWRRYCSGDGTMKGDVLGLAGEAIEGEPLLARVMVDGRRVGGLPSLTESRGYACAQLERLPPVLGGLEKTDDYPVEVSPRLCELARRVDACSAG